MRPNPDELWKDIIEKLFPAFIEFFHPVLFHDIIFKERPKPLDKEFNTIKWESNEQKRYIDKLIQVKVKPGIEKWVLVHIEIQGYRDRDFPIRMFTYFYRIYDRYKKDITALVIFTDPDKNYRPGEFIYNVYGTELRFKYNTYKIIDYNDAMLKESKNIFSLVILSAKYALYAKDDEEKKVRFTKELIRLMYQKGKTKDDIINLFKFISGVLYITDPLKKKIIKEEVRKIEEVRKVSYISYIEEDAKKEGLKEGMQQGLQVALKLKFGKKGIEFYKKYVEKEKALEKLQDLLNKLEDAKDLKDLM